VPVVMRDEGAQMLLRSVHAKMKVSFSLVALSMALGLLVGCDSAGKMAELEQYVREVKARPAKPIDPLPEIRPYATYAYDAQELRDPFEPLRVAEEQAVAQATGEGGLRPDLNRQKELLELFPLDSLRMVGILERDGMTWALVQSSDKAIHRIREGNYLGQNYGKVTHVSEQQIDLVEIVPNGQGGWIERQAQLAMKE